MTEAFLHFVWQTLRFDFRQLRTTAGEKIEIVRQGRLNPNQGPDFLEARIRINNVDWAGSVEIHTNGDEWYRHRHHTDEKYNNVILHVVFSPSTRPIKLQNQTTCPELVIGEKIPLTIIETYQHMQSIETQLPCAHALPSLPATEGDVWLTLMGASRLRTKSEGFLHRLAQTQYDWEQVAWEAILGSMGGKVNGEIFERLGRHLPFAIVRIYSTQPLYLEALLLGTLGLLPAHSEDEYVQLLIQHYQFLAHKHQLTLMEAALSYLRMRPVAFPEVRLAQLTALMSQFHSLVSLWEDEDFQSLLEAEICPSAFWLTHYRLDNASVTKPKELGIDQKINLILNVLVPLGVQYRLAHGREDAMDWGVNTWLALPSETNTLTKKYKNWGLNAKNALQSQGIIQLYQTLCTPKKCLECAIGRSILK